MLPTLSDLLLNVHVYKPVWSGSRSFVLSLSLNWQELQWELGAFGGPISAILRIKDQPKLVEEWLERLGYHIVIKDHQDNIVWCGYLNTVKISNGTRVVMRSLDQVHNRVKVSYTPLVDITIDPPVTGDQTETIYAQNTVSQDMYGIREYILQGGTLADDLTIGGSGNEAEQVRDAYLQASKDPSVSHEIPYGATEEPYASLECLGYIAMAGKYFYNSTATGYTTLSTMITNVLNADPNGILNTDMLINANPVITPRNVENQNARELLTKYASYGGANYERWLFYFERDRRARFCQIPSTFDYVFRNGEAYTPSNIFVYPWQVQAGRWAFIADYLRSVPVGVDIDPNSPYFMFIESVRFASPFTGTMSGNRITSVAQLLARKGISVT